MPLQVPGLILTPGQRCKEGPRHEDHAEGEQGVPTWVCHTGVQIPAPLLAEPRQHGHQLSSAPNAAPRMEAWLPTHEDVGGQGRH